MNVEIPDSIRVGGYVYEIVSDKETDKILIAEGFVGRADHQELKIKIRTDLNDQMKVNTFLHETLHCIDNVYNGNELDEKVIDVLANGLHQVIKQLKDNDF